MEVISRDRWVEFEPTASQPEISRTPSENELPTDQPRDPFASELLLRFRLKSDERCCLLADPFRFDPLLHMDRALALSAACTIAAIEKIYRKLYRFGRPLPANAQKLRRRMSSCKSLLIN